MNNGLKEIVEEIQTKFRRPPQVKSSKAQIHAKFHKIPAICFEDQKLTSFSGLLIFQLLFMRLNLKKRLKKCFSHIKVSPIFGHHLIVLLLIVHLLLGFRRLREVDYYRDDPLVLRLLGLRKLPDVSTISRALSQMEDEGIDKYRQLSRDLVTEGLIREMLPRLTLARYLRLRACRRHGCRIQQGQERWTQLLSAFVGLSGFPNKFNY